MKQSTRGFTIVELLIVIVVIAILAAIGVVAYNGVLNRSNDAAIKSDINSFAKKIRLAEAETGALPLGGAIRTGGVDSGDGTTFPGMTFSPTKSAYDSSVNNLYYCTGVITATSQPSFRIYTRSKSGTTFRYSSEAGLESLGNTTFSSGTCLTGYNDGGSWTYGHNTSQQAWHTSWIK